MFMFLHCWDGFLWMGDSAYSMHFLPPPPSQSQHCTPNCVEKQSWKVTRSHQNSGGWKSAKWASPPAHMEAHLGFYSPFFFIGLHNFSCYRWHVRAAVWKAYGLKNWVPSIILLNTWSVNIETAMGRKNKQTLYIESKI